MATTSATTSTYQQAPTSTAKSKAINGFLKNTIEIVLRNGILRYMKEVSAPVPQTQIITRSGEALGWMLTSLHNLLLAKQPWHTKRSNSEMKKTERSEFGQLKQTLGQQAFLYFTDLFLTNWRAASHSHHLQGTGSSN